MAGTRQSKRSTTRQTQLTFSPLPSSSPAASKAAEEHGDRQYASVRFAISHPGKRRKIDSTGSSEAARTLPTPAKSSQIPLNPKGTTVVALSDSDESDVVRPQQRRRRPQQQRLDFSNHDGLKSSDTEEGVINKMVKPGTNLGIFGSAPKKTVGRRLNDSESEDDLILSNRPIGTPEASRSSTTRRTRNSTSRRAPASSPLTHTRSGRKAAIVVESSSEDESEVNKVARRASMMNDPMNIAESETSGDDVPAFRSSPTRKPRRNAPAPEFVVLSSEEEDAADSEVSVESPKARKKGRHTRRHASEEDEHEDEEEEEPTPRKGRLSKITRKVTQTEEEDLAEDLEFLQSSPPPRVSKKKREPSAREKALEALKQRRASQAGPGSSIATAYEIEDEDEEEESEDEDTYRAENRRDMFLPEDEDEGFIVEAGSDDEIGAPEQIEMPLEFSHLSRAKAKDLFKYVVEWMVQKKINPAFDINNEIYRLAFQKLNDELQGLAGSKFMSSIWTQEFALSLTARPGITLVEIEGVLGCEACNRSSHYAKWDIQFTGKPYHPDTLEDIDQNPDDDDDDDDEDEDDEEAEEIDYRDRVVPPQDVNYKCGSTCKDNATTAHALQHWRYHLNQHIVDYLDESGYLTPRKIVQRDSHPTKKRRKEANKIVDEMDNSGKIRSIYDDFRKEVNIAREAKSGWRGRDYSA